MEFGDLLDKAQDNMEDSLQRIDTWNVKQR